MRTGSRARRTSRARSRNFPSDADGGSRRVQPVEAATALLRAGPAVRETPSSSRALLRIAFAERKCQLLFVAGEPPRTNAERRSIDCAATTRWSTPGASDRASSADAEWPSGFVGQPCDVLIQRAVHRDLVSSERNPELCGASRARDPDISARSMEGLQRNPPSISPSAHSRVNASSSPSVASRSA